MLPLFARAILRGSVLQNHLFLCALALSRFVPKGCARRLQSLLAFSMLFQFVSASMRSPRLRGVRWTCGACQRGLPPVIHARPVSACSRSLITFGHAKRKLGVEVFIPCKANSRALLPRGGRVAKAILASYLSLMCWGNAWDNVYDLDQVKTAM